MRNLNRVAARQTVHRRVLGRQIRPRALPQKTMIERAAIAACRMMNNGNCACADAPSVCEIMKSAALAVLDVQRREP